MMSFSHAIRTCLRRYADFRGRAPRTEFWWWWLGCGLVAGMMNLLQAALIASVAFEWWPEDWGFGPQSLLAFVLAQLGRIVNIAMILPSLAVTSRRLHDIGRSGWWQILWWPPASLALVLGVALFLFYGPFGLMGLEDSFSRDAAPWVLRTLIPAFIALAIVAAATFIMTVAWLSRQGQPVPNRFGPNPC